MDKTKLLVADDSVTIQKIIRLALSNESYEIRTVSNNKEATEQLALFQPKIVLLDTSLPGLDVNAFVRDAGAAKTILMSSAFDTTAIIKNKDFEHRLTKPFDPNQLRTMLREISRSLRNSSSAKTEVKKAAKRNNAEVEVIEMKTDLPPLPPKFKRPAELSDEWEIQEPISMGSAEALTTDEDLETELSSLDLEIDSSDDDDNDMTVHEDVTPITKEQMQAILKEQLETTFREIAQQMLPDIAEKIIREEISKILNQNAGQTATTGSRSAPSTTRTKATSSDISAFRGFSPDA